jgi:RNA polymerase sigma-70 factor (ECF subfamily)
MPREDADHALELEPFRPYLQALARIRLLGGPPAKVEVSDVVQQTLLQAFAKRAQFRGATEAEWKGWLRQILANVIAGAFRKLPDRESIRADLDESASRLEMFLPKVLSTPSQKLERDEQLLLLAEALETLTDDERTALELRYFHEPRQSMAEIARRLNRPTAKAVADLLARAKFKLREILSDSE